MDLEFSDEQLELHASARAVLASACPPSVVRAVYEGEGGAEELWSRLVQLDWPALGISEDNGGLGLGFLEVGILVEELGRVVAPTPYLATVTQLAPVLREAGADTWLAQIATGTTTGTLTVAEAGSWRLDAVRTTARRSGDGWVLDGQKTHVVDGGSAQEVAVVARDESGGLGAFLVPRDAMAGRPIAVLDPTLPLADLTLDAVEVPAERALLDPTDPGSAPALVRVLEEATVAVALSTVATTRAVFEATLQYAKDREQFGRPIGSFQALKHRLADGYLAVERAASLCYFAALTIVEDDDRRAQAAAMAKAAAGDCQRLVVADGLQLHGGIGFTWEHDLHFALKRAKTGDLLFGTAAAHRAALAPLLGLVTA